MFPGMRSKNSVVIGQRVDPTKLSLAKQFRREMTASERTLWQALRNNQIDGLHFRRQQIIAGFIVDFYCHAAGLVVEVDGDIHDPTGTYDRERDRLLECHGFKVLRLRNELILANLTGALAEIRAAIGQDCQTRFPLPNREGGQGVR